MSDAILQHIMQSLDQHVDCRVVARGWSLIAAIKKELEGTAAAQLSHADLIALAGAHAVATTGGPVIEVPIGMQLHMSNTLLIKC